jgi:hypothetical protein
LLARNGELDGPPPAPFPSTEDPEDPIRIEMFSADRLEQHAEGLASRRTTAVARSHRACATMRASSASVIAPSPRSSERKRR